MATDPTDITQETTRSTQKTVPERVPGTTMLPLARIKRVIKEDKDVSLINAEATFCIAYATELFMEYLVTEAFTKAKTEKRKTVYYRDLASTVKEVDQFEFLEDVIPATMTLKAAIEKRKETLHDDTPLPSSPPAKKQKTSNNASSSSSTKPKSTEDDETSALEEEEEEPSLDDQDDAVMEDPK